MMVVAVLGLAARPEAAQQWKRSSSKGTIRNQSTVVRLLTTPLNLTAPEKFTISATLILQRFSFL